MATRAQAVERRKYLKTRIKKLRCELKAMKNELIRVPVMLEDGDFSGFKTVRLPTRGTKWRKLIEILAEDPERAWSIDELMVRVDLDPKGGRHVRERFRGRMYALERRGEWVQRVGLGQWKVTKASLLKLKSNPR